MLGSVMNTSMIYAQGRAFPKGSYRKNRNRIERLIAEDPQTDYYYELARLEAIKQNWDRAQNAIEQLLEIEPSLVEGMLFLAQVLESKGELDKSESLYLRILQKQPASSVVFREYGRFLLERESFALARTHLLRALELNPADAYAHSLLAELSFHLGYLGQAVLHLHLGSNQPELHPFYYPRSARLWMSMGYYEEAVSYWKCALQLEPKNQLYRNQLRQAVKAKQKSLNQRIREAFTKK